MTISLLIIRLVFTPFDDEANTNRYKASIHASVEVSVASSKTGACIYTSLDLYILAKYENAFAVTTI